MRFSEQDEAASINVALSYYRDDFVPAYADVVALLGDKPTQLLVEIENFNSHLVAALYPSATKPVIEGNLRKACGHLERATLDCYKLILINLYSKLNEFSRLLQRSDKTKEVLSCLAGIQGYLSKIMEARKKESLNTGKVELKEAVEIYKLAAQEGFQLYRKLAGIYGNSAQ
jgi:hypothetical protein